MGLPAMGLPAAADRVLLEDPFFSRPLLPVSPPDPTDREAAFRRLLELLGGPVSGRWAVSEAESFLARLDPERPETESYVLSLIEPLAETAETLTPVGLSPNLLVRLADHLQAARTRHPALQNLSPVGRTEQALRRRAALLYAYAGAMGAAIEQLSGSPASVEHSEADGRGPRGVLSEDASNEEGRSGTAPRDRLRRARTEASATALTEALQWLEQHWAISGDDRQGNRSRPEHQAWVPVVERLPSWAQRARPRSRRPDVGGLRRVAIELYASEAGQAASRDENAKGENAQDQLWTDLSSSEDRETLTGGPVAAARALLNREHPALRRQPFEGRIVADRSNAGHEGASAGLAAAALFYCTALREGRSRIQFHIREEAAFTGGLSEEGAALPVGGESLPLKVRVAFFSPLRALAVPSQQQGPAREAAASLKEEFPCGRLRVIGVERLRDLFDHRRLTGRDEVGRLRHAARRAWDRRAWVAAGTLVSALLLALGALLYGPLDKNPVQARYAGATMILKNDSGREIERIEVGKGIGRRYRQNQFHKPVGFADAAGGARNEVFWVAATGPPQTNYVLRAKAVGADTLLWERPLRFDPSFDRKVLDGSRAFKPEALLARDLTGEGRPELYVTVGHMPYFPSLLLRVDPREGTVRQRYAHPGYFATEIHAKELDRDGRQELLVGAYSNAFEDPALVVLDPENVEGHAPTTEEYRPRGLAPARHHAYLRFPPTKVQNEAPTTHRPPTSIRLTSADHIVVEYQDGRLKEAKKAPEVLMHLDERLRPTAMGTSSTHDRLARQLVSSGRLNGGLGPGDRQRLQREVRYWTGSGWSAEPRMSTRQ